MLPTSLTIHHARSSFSSSPAQGVKQLSSDPWFAVDGSHCTVFALDLDVEQVDFFLQSSRCQKSPRGGYFSVSWRQSLFIFFATRARSSFCPCRQSPRPFPRHERYLAAFIVLGPHECSAVQSPRCVRFIDVSHDVYFQRIDLVARHFFTNVALNIDEEATTLRLRLQRLHTYEPIMTVRLLDDEDNSYADGEL